MESKNLIIRKTCFDDLRLFAEWEAQEDVKAFLSIDDTRSGADVVRESILYEQDPSKQQFTIVLKEGGAPIGRVYISRIDPDTDSLDLTRVYIADNKLRGKGLGEEAMRLLLDHSFVTMEAERVTIDHYTDNKRASALFTKLGFKGEGVARNSCKKNGKYYDLRIMSMLRAEYFERET